MRQAVSVRWPMKWQILALEKMFAGIQHVKFLKPVNNLHVVSVDRHLQIKSLSDSCHQSRRMYMPIPRTGKLTIEELDIKSEPLIKTDCNLAITWT